MPNLQEKPLLKDFQTYVNSLESERGFDKQNVVEKCLLLGEEIGELFKAIRKSEKISIDENSKIGLIEDELADVFIYICSIANRCDVDLEMAFRNKEKINKKRTWNIFENEKEATN